jgi:2-polyprenyl-6-methoxyphenol hydroxylase-like FAD-dependent oxidoreductase
MLERTYSDLLHLSSTHPCYTVAVIGGGPVGLWVALQMKLLAREWDVHVFEKREAYARSHALRLLPLSFEGLLTKGCGDMSALHDLVDQWVAAGSSPRTNDIERQLSAACEVAGVAIHRNQGSVTGTL